jgi:hypothetical protein
MTFWQRLLDALKALFDTQGPAFPPPVPPVPPPPPPAPRAVTKDDDFRTLPTISKERFCEILTGYPMEGECDQVHATMQGNPLPLSQSWMESNYGQNDNALRTHNPLGLLWNETTPGKPYVEVGANGATVKLLKFNTWAEAFAEWRRRMDAPGYRGNVYPQGMTLGEFIRTYVAGPGPGYANGESAESVERYLNETVNRLNRYYGISTPVPAQEYTAHMIPGLTNALLLPKGIHVRMRMTPLGVAGRSGRRLQTPFQVTRHTTNNERAGTDAWQHAGWQAMGAEGNPDIAVHAYVDDTEVVVTMPFNEQGVHSGDWRNQQSIATELTRHRGINRPRAEQNAIDLDAGILNAIGGNVEQNLWPHTNGGHCPDLSITWSEYEARVDAALRRLP